MDDASKQNSGTGGGGAAAGATAADGAAADKSQGQQQTKQTELAFKLYDKGGYTYDVRSRWGWGGPQSNRGCMNFTVY